jgi:hypothetical protein
MEPDENPYAALLAIDFPAMKAREYQYLIDLRDADEWIDETGYLLNIHYSAALAEYMLEKDQKKDHTNSSEALARAIQRFPWLIAQLFFELKLTFPANFPTTVPPSPLQAVYTDLYIHRSKELWTIAEISSWLNAVAKQTASQVDPSAPQSEATIPMNVARHVYVMGVPALMSHVPREYTSRTQLAIDPLPPPNSISPYDATEGGNLSNIRRIPRPENPRVLLNQDNEPRFRDEDVPYEGPVDNLLVDEVDDDEPHVPYMQQPWNRVRQVFGWFGMGNEPAEETEWVEEFSD